MGIVILPFDRARLAKRNALDEAQEIEQSASLTPSERLEETFELSDFVLSLAEAAGTSALADARNRLEDKARLYALPLRLLARSCKPS